MITFPKTSATTHTFKNGFTVILDPNPAHPVISTQLWVETGSMHEDGYLGSGISHLLEHMVFKGTETYSGDDLAGFVQSKGGHWNAYTSFDRTVYYIDGPSESKSDFLNILHQLVFKPLLPESELEKEKEVIHREMAMGDDDPDSQLSKLLFSTVFQVDARQFPVIGHRSLFDQLSHQDLCEYHKSRYTPENTFLSISGDFDPVAILSELEALFGSEPRGASNFVPLPSDSLQIGDRKATLHFDIPNAKLCLAWQIEGMAGPYAAEIDVLSSIISNGRTSILYRRLREELELCYGVSAYAWQPQSGRGFFAISAIAKPENLETLKEEILKIVASLSSEFTEKSLKKIIRQELIQQMEVLTTASGRASDLASNWNEARHLDFTSLYLEKLQAVTLEGLEQAAANVFNPERLNDIRLLPKETESSKTGTTATPDSTASEQKQTSENSVEELTLSNGLKVALYADSTLPSIHVALTWACGLLSETKETNGINGLIASLLTQGAGPLSSAEFSDQKETLGISISSSSGNNSSSIYLKTLNDTWAESCELLGYILKNPHFEPEALERERATKIAQWEQLQLDPVGTAFGEIRKRLFAGTAYQLQSVGNEQSLKTIDRDTLIEHYRTHYQEGSPCISVSGSFDRETILADLEALLKDFNYQAPTNRDVSINPDYGDYELSLPREQAVHIHAYSSYGAESKHLPTMDLLQEYLGDMAGPLFETIREDLGLAYYINVSQFQGMGTGLFGFYLGTSLEQLPEAKEALEKEIEKLKTNLIPDDILSSLKTSWISGHLLNEQSNEAIAQSCALNLALGKPANDSFDKLNQIKSVTAEQIQQVCRELFEQKSVTVSVLPEA